MKTENELTLAREESEESDGSCGWRSQQEGTVKQFYATKVILT